MLAVFCVFEKNKTTLKIYVSNAYRQKFTKAKTAGIQHPKQHRQFQPEVSPRRKLHRVYLFKNPLDFCFRKKIRHITVWNLSIRRDISGDYVIFTFVINTSPSFLRWLSFSFPALGRDTVIAQLQQRENLFIRNRAVQKNRDPVVFIHVICGKKPFL